MPEEIKERDKTLALINKFYNIHMEYRTSDKLEITSLDGDIGHIESDDRYDDVIFFTINKTSREKSPIVNTIEEALAWAVNDLNQKEIE